MCSMNLHKQMSETARDRQQRRSIYYQRPREEVTPIEIYQQPWIIIHHRIRTQHGQGPYFQQKYSRLSTDCTGNLGIQSTMRLHTHLLRTQGYRCPFTYSTLYMDRGAMPVHRQVYRRIPLSVPFDPHHGHHHLSKGSVLSQFAKEARTIKTGCGANLKL